MFVAAGLSAGRKRDRQPGVDARPMSSDFETAWYLRFFVRDQPGIVARLAQILAAHHLNIDSLLQKPGFEKTSLPFVITLEPCRDSHAASGAGRNVRAGFRDSDPASACRFSADRLKKTNAGRLCRPALRRTTGKLVPERIFQTCGRHRAIRLRFRRRFHPRSSRR